MTTYLSITSQLPGVPETIPRIEKASGEFKIMSMLLTVK